MKRWVVAAGLLMGLALPGAAAAKRPASDTERAAVADGFGLPAECVVVNMSTVDASWARLDGNYDACPDQLGNGFAVMHFDAGAWSSIAEGSENLGACGAYDVPLAVGRDLGVCRARRTYALCANRRATARYAKVRPRVCNTLGPSDGFAQAVNLTGLRWRRWGRSVATARGIERGFHLPLQHVKVRVRAYRRREGCAGDWIYTRWRVGSKYGRTIVRQPVDCE